MSSPPRDTPFSSGDGNYTSPSRSERAVRTGGGARALVGVDVGGTGIKSGVLVMGEQKLRRFSSQPTRSHRPRAEVLADLASIVASLRENAEGEGFEVLGVGVGLPAAMSSTGVIEVLPNFAAGWAGIAVGPELEELTGLPVVMVNDARAFTLAEATLGAAAGARAVLGMTLGTGVGGGIVLNGELHLGPSAKAGEFGHTTVDPSGPLCGCGSRGCLEVFASAPALVAAVTRPYLQGRLPRLRELTGERVELVTPELVGEAAKAGDDECQQAIETIARYLGIAAANATVLLGLDHIVVGGGLAGLGDALLEPLARTLREYASVANRNLPVINQAALGQEGGAIGAALRAQEVIRHGLK